jgi:hypothetical protein
MPSRPLCRMTRCACLRTKFRSSWYRTTRYEALEDAGVLSCPGVELNAGDVRVVPLRSGPVPPTRTRVGRVVPRRRLGPAELLADLLEERALAHTPVAVDRQHERRVLLGREQDTGQLDRCLVGVQAGRGVRRCHDGSPVGPWPASQARTDDSGR